MIIRIKDGLDGVMEWNKNLKIKAGNNDENDRPK